MPIVESLVAIYEIYELIKGTSEIGSKILRTDPFQKAIDTSIDELIQEYPNSHYILKNISDNRENFFNKTTITDKNTFNKILIKKGLNNDEVSKLYNKIEDKFKSNIKILAKSNERVFPAYIIDKIDKIDANYEELKKELKEIAKRQDKILESECRHEFAVKIDEQEYKSLICKANATTNME